MTTAPVLALARFITRLSLERVPALAMERAKLHVLDAIATAVAAQNRPIGNIVARSLDPIDEGGSARILATGARASVGTAAFINTQMSVALDLGTNLYYSQGLGGLALFGPLAMAEHSSRSGKALLEAVIAGFEVAGRVALSFPPNWRVEGGRVTGAPASGVGRTTVGLGDVGTRWIAIGAAAANAKLRGLSDECAAHALALTAAAVPLTQRPTWGKAVPMAKYGLVGGMAHSALTNVLLAERGFTGDLEILGAPDGFHHALGKACADSEAMTRDYGQRWLITEAGFKRYPSGTHNQQAIHTVQTMVHEHRIDPAGIRAIRIGRAIGTGGAFANNEPGNEIAAQFSLAFAVSAATLGIAPRDWHRELGNARIRELAGLVRLTDDSEAIEQFGSLSSDAQRSPWPLRSRVTIETTEGVVERWSNYGEVTSAEIAAKFRRFCEGILSESQLADIVNIVARLEQVPDVRAVGTLFEQRP